MTESSPEKPRLISAHAVKALPWWIAVLGLIACVGAFFGGFQSVWGGGLVVVLLLSVFNKFRSQSVYLHQGRLEIRGVFGNKRILELHDIERVEPVGSGYLLHVRRGRDVPVVDPNPSGWNELLQEVAANPFD